MDVTSSHDWFVIFDTLPNVVCIEPQSGPPNGINDGLVAPVAMVRPGQPITLVTTWRLTRGRPPG
jgi:aldose 1-epimerase